MSKREESHEAKVARYMSSFGVPLTWSHKHKVFTGLAGHLIKRINPRAETASPWIEMPKYLRKFEYATRARAVVIVNDKNYSQSIDDMYVVMRLGTLMPMLKALYESDREKWRQTNAASSIW